MRHEDAPPLVIWETSQACDLACPQCQTSASPREHVSELNTEEGIRLLDQIGSFGNPWVIFTGSDPLKRPDLFLLIRKSVSLGLRTDVCPSATAFLSREAIRQFKKEGAGRMAIGMDDAAAPMFDCAMDALEEARRVGLETLVYTTVTRWNLHQLDELAERVGQAKARAWSVFVDQLTEDAQQEVFEDLYRISHRAEFEIKTTEEKSYRRYLARRRGGASPTEQERVSRGFVFISHSGEIHPSGFLGVSAGNVRFDSPLEVYRNSSLFTLFRDADRGECGGCDYRRICGGTRARNFAVTRERLASPSPARFSMI